MTETDTINFAPVEPAPKREKGPSLKHADSELRVARIAEVADDMKALDIVTIDVRTKTSVTDFFVVCTGTSDTHVRAISDRVSERLRDAGLRPRRDGNGQGQGWILLDYGDVVLHVMLEETRQFYDLESLWINKSEDPTLIQS